jgi:lipoprotein-releasing system permease protein
MNSLEWFIALRYLKSKRKEVFISIITVISVLGVAVSVLVLNLVLAVMTGFEEELQSKLLNTSAHVTVRSFTGEISNWTEVRDQINQVPGITEITPYTYHQALLSTESGAHGLLIRGVADEAISRSKLQKVLSPGSDLSQLFNPSETEILRPDGKRDFVKLPAILVGKALRNRYGLLPGSVVSLFSSEMSSSPQGLVPRMKRFVVVGSYESGLMEYESGLAYMSLRAAQDFFRMGESVSGLEVMVEELNNAAQYADKIREQLQSGESNRYDIADWTVPNKPLWDALKLEKRVYFIVLLLLILIASFSIISTLVMVVMEKSKDIAILKTLGLRDRRVLRIFLFQGMIIGLMGTVIGTFLGYVGCIGLREYGFPLDINVFSLDKLPVKIISSNFVLVAVSAFLITTLAGVYPAYRASKLRPADAIRFE